MNLSLPQIYLIRHGETEWSHAGRHTSFTDLPLLASGEDQARGLKSALQPLDGTQIWSSPRQRAQRTAALAGLGDLLEVIPDLAEWNYGEYEGLTTAEIQARRPDWNLFEDGCPGGESANEVSDRADRVVAALRAATGNILVFSHGHFLRSLAARWVRWPVTGGRRLLLKTASISRLSFEHDRPDEPVIAEWNTRR